MAEQEKDKGYDVVDKRKVKLGEDGEVHVEPEAEQPEQAAETEEAAAMNMNDLPPVDIHSLLKSFIGILGAHAWQWLGLVKNPVTGHMDRDLGQAKVAIDSIASLIDKLEGEVSASEQEELKGLLSDLRINFVQQSAKESQEG